MSTVIIQTLLTVASALVGGLLAYKGTKSTNRANTEAAYAQTMPDLVEKVQELLGQLESKNGKIAELTDQVRGQSQTIDALTKQIGKMQSQINKLTGGKKNEEDLEERK